MRVLVTGGAGYGKTTLVAQAIRKHEFQTVWYFLDSSDADLPTFMSYLIVGIQKYYPDFFKDLESVIE